MSDADRSKDDALRASVRQHLSDAGWTATYGTALASKTVDTAVGNKVAFAYLADFGPDLDMMLQGEYQTEGRNALGNQCALVPRSSSRAHLRALVTEFVHGCEATIATTYAVRLLASGFKAPPCIPVAQVHTLSESQS